MTALSPLPSPATPSPLCMWVSRSDGPCTLNPVAGGRFCQRHGGALERSEVRQSHLFAAYAGIVEASSTAVDALVDVANFSNNDLARVQAANSLLDRAGLGLESQLLAKLAQIGEQEQQRIETVERLAERLSAVADRLEFAPPSSPSPRNGHVVEAQVLE